MRFMSTYSVVLSVLAALAPGVHVVRAERASAAPQASPSAVKNPPSDEIIALCGARLAKVFSRIGTPENVTPLRRSKPELDRVLMVYGAYAVEIRDKTAQACLFYSDYPLPVKGVKIGFTRDQVENALGKTHKVEKSSIDVEDYGYTLKDMDAMFWIDFDKDGKVRMIEVQLN